MTQPVPFATRQHDLASKPRPIRPAGAVGQLADRILVYAGPRQFSAVLPHIDPDHSGLIIVQSGTTEKQIKTRGDLLRRVAESYSGLVLTDPAAHRQHGATPDRPFLLPEDTLFGGDLNSVLDDQRRAGAAVALTPTGYIDAGDTDALRCAAATVTRIDRNDMIFMVPIAVAMLGRTFFPQTSAILQDVPCPVALLLGGQFDPIDHSPRTVITNLRQLAMTLRHMAAFGTDLNAFDVVAHGGFAAAIGSGSSLRHVIRPGEQPKSADPTDRSPSVLFPELATWRRGSTIAKWFGMRRSRTCCCAACDGRPLAGFLNQEDQHAARAHDVATWHPWAYDLLTQPTIGDRTKYWRTFCTAAVREHEILAQQLQLLKPLPCQEALKAWATLPPWPDQPAPHQS
jgi:hypothetical protein